MMYYLKQWSQDLDLTEFYTRCKERGYTNNSSEKKLIGSIQKEHEWNCWILYSDSTPIGSVAAHSFDEVMGPNTYRVLARTCAFKEFAPSKGLNASRPKAIIEHQHFTDQFFVPVCLDWAGDNRVFATSNGSPTAEMRTQKLVHNYYFPMLERLELVTRVGTFDYKNADQTVWEIHKGKFLDHLNQYPRWNLG